jgi:hypothetical protein
VSGVTALPLLLAVVRLPVIYNTGSSLVVGKAAFLSGAQIFDMM